MGQRLKEIRVKAGLTQDEVAERMGLTGKLRRREIERLDLEIIGKIQAEVVSRFFRFLTEEPQMR